MMMELEEGGGGEEEVETLVIKGSSAFMSSSLKGSAGRTDLLLYKSMAAAMNLSKASKEKQKWTEDKKQEREDAKTRPGSRGSLEEAKRYSDILSFREE